VRRATPSVDDELTQKHKLAGQGQWLDRKVMTCGMTTQEQIKKFP
jgi:hypothetical protein